MSCLFCKIAKKELPASILYQDKNFLAFNDINPISPVHILIIPKKHIPSLDKISFKDKELIGNLFLTAKKIAKIQGVQGSGYRLILNIGKNAGQTVDHLHLHLLGGKKLLWQ